MVLAGAVVLIVDGQDEGIIGGLILSDLAVKVGLFVPETVLYRTLAGIGTFATPSLEFALSIRMFRFLILITTGIFGI